MTTTLFLQIIVVIFLAFAIIYSSAFAHAYFEKRAELRAQAMTRHPSVAHLSLDEFLED